MVQFLLVNSKQTTYNIFFSKLASVLRDYTRETKQIPIFGSDKESSIQLEIDNAFNDCKILSCTQHMRENDKNSMQKSYNC